MAQSKLRGRAWSRLISRLIRASAAGEHAKGYADFLGALGKVGIDVAPFSQWVPTPQEGDRLRQAQRIMSKLLDPKAPQRAKNYTTLQQLLPTDQPHGQVLLQLATSMLQQRGVLTVAETTTTAHDTELEQPPTIGTRPVVFAAERSQKKRSASAARPLRLAAFRQHCENLSDQLHARTWEGFFQTSADTLRIYIDESWPEGDQGTGNFGGLVWCGASADPSILPFVDTHLLRSVPGSRNGSRTAARDRYLRAVEALQDLLHCPRCFPFVMPLRVEDGLAQRQYDRLVIGCLLIVLGWLVRCTLPRVRVQVFLERHSQREAGGDATEWYRGVLDALSMFSPTRFQHIDLQLVQWCEKDFEFIPYGDLMAYLLLEHTERSVWLGTAANVRAWPGYVPLSLELTPRLLRLDNLEASGAVEDALDVVADLGQSPLGRLVTLDLQQRLEARPDLQARLRRELLRREQNLGEYRERLRVQQSAASQLLPPERLPAIVRE